MLPIIHTVNCVSVPVLLMYPLWELENLNLLESKKQKSQPAMDPVTWCIGTGEGRGAMKEE